MNVVDPLPLPKVVPVTPNNTLKVDLETAAPLHNNQPAGILLVAPDHITTLPIGAMLLELSVLNTVTSPLKVASELTTTSCPLAASRVKSPEVVSIVSPLILTLPNSDTPLASIFPLTFKSLTLASAAVRFPTVIPPLTSRASSAGEVILTLLAKVVSPLYLTLLLNVTGPSNSDKTVPEFPPSTKSLSLTITSSNTTLNLDGSCPVIVGIGILNVTSLPVVELDFLLPRKKSPLLLIPEYRIEPQESS